MIKPAYSVSFLLSINIFVWQNVLYFLDAPCIIIAYGSRLLEFYFTLNVYVSLFLSLSIRHAFKEVLIGIRV